MNRKLFTNATALVLLTLGAAGSAHALSDVEGCNNKLLYGHYGFTLQGTKYPIPGVSGPTGLQVGVAMADFDGDGTFQQIDSVTIAGEPASNFTHTPANGKYTVNPDCTGTFTIDFTDGRPPVVTDFVVVENGSEIDTVVTSVAGKEGILSLGSIGKKVRTW
ncbi:MAG: hypothetical protein ABSC65_21510 [Acidobacteriaceae bacterium]|jgi:hypothetical protein